MKKFTIPCVFGNEKAPFDVYIGDPAPNNHPLRFQSAWLAARRNGVIPQEVMESFEKLRALALKHNVSFEDLCVHAMKAVNKPDDSSNGPSGSGNPA